MERTTNNFYPGLFGPDVEIFNHPDQGLKILSDGQVKPFSQAPFALIAILLEKMEAEPESKKILEQWHPGSSMKQVHQFAGCRFGGLDYEADIKDNQLQDGEFHPCPHRGGCSAEGILCKMPIINGTRLTLQVVKLMRLLSGTDTNEVIAEKMDLPLGTYHLLKKQLYATLGVQTKQEVALISRNLTIV
tara:strand:- start:229 stop:795 length:567 start_codon:yes stop_codon:yes gene_type:complete